MELDAFAHHCSRLNSAKIAPVREVINENTRGNDGDGLGGFEMSFDHS